MNRAKGSFTYDKGAMDASNPYTYGETNIKSISNKTESTEQKSDSTKTKKKHFWDNW